MPTSRFHDGKSGATHLVRVIVFGRELQIVGEGGITLALWRIEQTRSAPELDPDGAVVLSARDQPGVLLIDDSGELADLHGAGIWLPGHKAWTRGRWIAVCVGFVGVLAVGMLSVASLPRWLATAVPLSWERKAGNQAAALITAGHGRCDGAAAQSALDHLVERLRAAGGIKMPVTLSVLDDKAINAFTLPGGQVLVMRGLIDASTDGPMLAGVIAHELGHVAHRDPTTLLIRGLGFALLLDAIGLGHASGVAGGATNLMNLAFSRAAEAAADESAIDFLTKAGLRADGLSRFFAMMERRESARVDDAGKPADPKANDQTGSTLGWFATHPSSESRRERTARPDTGELPFTDDEWLAIRTMCGGR